MKDVNTFMFGQRQKETFISNFTNLAPPSSARWTR
jgi:hypothetical protein